MGHDYLNKTKTKKKVCQFNGIILQTLHYRWTMWLTTEYKYWGEVKFLSAGLLLHITHGRYRLKFWTPFMRQKHVLFCSFVDCGILERPENGAVYTPGGTSYGRTAMYVCYPGYSVIGAARVTCEADGAWSLEPPTCRRTSMYLLSNTIQEVGTAGVRTTSTVLTSFSIGHVFIWRCLPKLFVHSSQCHFVLPWRSMTLTF